MSINAGFSPLLDTIRDARPNVAASAFVSASQSSVVERSSGAAVFASHGSVVAWSGVVAGCVKNWTDRTKARPFLQALGGEAFLDCVCGVGRDGI